MTRPSLPKLWIDVEIAKLRVIARTAHAQASWHGVEIAESNVIKDEPRS